MAGVFRWLVKFLIIHGLTQSFKLENRYQQQDNKVSPDKHQSQTERIENLTRAIVKRLTVEKNIARPELASPPHVFQGSAAKDTYAAMAKRISFHDEHTFPDKFISQDRTLKTMNSALDSFPSERNLVSQTRASKQLPSIHMIKPRDKKRLSLDQKTFDDIKAIIRSSVLKKHLVTPVGAENHYHLRPLHNSVSASKTDQDGGSKVHARTNDLSKSNTQKSLAKSSKGIKSNIKRNYDMQEDPPGLHTSDSKVIDSSTVRTDDNTDKVSKDPPGLHTSDSKVIDSSTVRTDDNTDKISNDPPGLHASDSKVIDSSTVRTDDNTDKVSNDPPGLHASDSKVIDSHIVRTGVYAYKIRKDPPGLHASDTSAIATIRSGNQIQHSLQSLPHKMDPPGLHLSDEPSLKYTSFQSPNLSPVVTKEKNFKESANNDGDAKWTIEKLKSLLEDIKKLQGTT